MDHDDGEVWLNRTAQRRGRVLNQLLSEEPTNAQAAELLGVSQRQVKRLRAAYRQEGPAALAPATPRVCHGMACPPRSAIAFRSSPGTATRD
jgi:hypothetical protein